MTMAETQEIQQLPLLLLLEITAVEMGQQLLDQTASGPTSWHWRTASFQITTRDDSCVYGQQLLDQAVDDHGQDTGDLAASSSIISRDDSCGDGSTAPWSDSFRSKVVTLEDSFHSNYYQRWQLCIWSTAPGSDSWRPWPRHRRSSSFLFSYC